MKIQPEVTQAAPVQQAESTRADGPGSIAQRKTARRTPEKGDVVELSTTLDRLAGQQEQSRADRVASLKARVAAGTYQVDSRAVAQKLLSKGSGI